MSTFVMGCCRAYRRIARAFPHQEKSEKPKPASMGPWVAVLAHSVTAKRTEASARVQRDIQLSSMSVTSKMMSTGKARGRFRIVCRQVHHPPTSGELSDRA